MSLNRQNSQNSQITKVAKVAKLAKLTIFGLFNELLSTQNVNVARFAGNVE